MRDSLYGAVLGGLGLVQDLSHVEHLASLNDDAITDFPDLNHDFHTANIHEERAGDGVNSFCQLTEDYPPLGIIISMRDIHLVLSNIVEHLGKHDRVASLCTVTPNTVYRWTQPPSEGGKTIPVKHLQTILSESKKHLENITLQALVNELLQDHFASLCLRRVILEDVLSEALFLLSNGCKPAGRMSA